jgi:hypothetical protein
MTNKMRSPEHGVWHWPATSASVVGRRSRIRIRVHPDAPAQKAALFFDSRCIGMQY